MFLTEAVENTKKSTDVSRYYSQDMGWTYEEICFDRQQGKTLKFL
jgi:hypothetical protein